MALSVKADKETILNLGGPAKVAELLGYNSRQRVQNWMVRGIPSRVKLEYPHLFLNPNIQRSKSTAA
ncbi:MAG TPA: hypothetical protein DCM33_07150 [Acinetobacter radioresistens]|jgi:hypothetical protein|uniref:hypothetical protein n=1 Tax=Acinetobacter TaxID=469 RepID=UPI00044D65BC|nr:MULTISPECIES: hypothetical protein [Acinetobacter]EXE11395.1 hypothetical protein J559_3233 [Acinetobacter sp. 983759]MCX0337447.1 hypothetical protein [Acinetobacter radioresistens]MCX0343613.1 hypothetical protein [Acinetobacter radioresistens]PKD80220.1 hypothetical protein CW313_13595 [Acinetobacter radioresistens]PKH28745.1 hypothetical protein BJF94_12370 [Acinetobacter radioresistens]